MNVQQRVRRPAGAARQTAGSHPPAKRQKTNARDRILNAVLAITEKSGVGHLSLEAIARQAGVSKGGLLYHFPTKKSLMRALVEHHLSLTEQAIVEAELTARSPNAVATALVRVSRKMCDVKKPPRAQEGALAAFVEDPSLFDPIRAHHRRVAERLRVSAADPDLSLIALLALEGIKAHEILALDFLKEADKKRILDRLAVLLQQGG
jgi:AcrR family transcriptional regulator